MPLRDANVVDALRDGDVVRDALAHLADRDRFFEAPEVLPPRDHPVYRDALPGPPITSSTDVEARLEAVNACARAPRRRSAAAAFLERPQRHRDRARGDRQRRHPYFGGN